MTETSQLLNRHRSIRNYKPDPIDPALVEQVCADAIAGASSSGNLNSVTLILTRDAERKRKLYELHFEQEMVLQAPLVITFCADWYRTREWLRKRGARDNFNNLLGYHVAAFDAIIVAQNVCLGFEALGLGICYMGTTLHSMPAIAEFLELPDTCVPVTTIVAGWPDEDPAKRDRLPMQGLPARRGLSAALGFGARSDLRTARSPRLGAVHGVPGTESADRGIGHHFAGAVLHQHGQVRPRRVSPRFRQAARIARGQALPALMTTRVVSCAISSDHARKPMMPTPFRPALRSAILPVAIVMATVLAGCSSAPADDPRAAAERAQAVIASPIRTDQDRRMDASRRPAEFLPFTTVKPGMQVLDFAAGGGYTSQLMALSVGPAGKVWAQRVSAGEAMTKRLTDAPQANFVVVLRPFDDPVPEQAPKLDLITLVNNYHDITYLAVDRDKMNQRLFAALKPGGKFVVVDHSAKAGADISSGKTLHRIDQAIVIAEVRKAGFVLEAEGDFLRDPADTREASSGDAKIPTDKFRAAVRQAVAAVRGGRHGRCAFQWIVTEGGRRRLCGGLVPQFLDVDRLDFVLPRIAHARRIVAVAHQHRHDDADQQRRQMGFPGNAGIDRQHAPRDRAVHESDDHRRGDRAAVAPQESGHEDVRDQAIDQATGADVNSISCEQPHGNARDKIDHRQHAKGRMRVDVEHGGAENHQRQGIRDEVPEVRMQQRRHQDSGQSRPIAGAECRTPRVQVPTPAAESARATRRRKRRERGQTKVGAGAGRVGVLRVGLVNFHGQRSGVRSSVTWGRAAACAMLSPPSRPEPPGAHARRP
jgi:predicted methyltransferase/nitroreductase